MDTLFQDLRFALRTLRKNLSVTVLVTLSLHERPLLTPTLETLQQLHRIADVGTPDSS